MTATFLAVVGMACRLPGARNVDDLWHHLLEGRESVTHLAPTSSDEDVPAMPYGVVDDADSFDAEFFGFSPLDALILDPQQRLFLECAVEALENAGWVPASFPGSIGVFAGSSHSTYLDMLNAHRTTEQLRSVSPWQLRLANGMDFLTSRAAYKLGLTGPAVTVQTACSTSLVAIHLAGQALLAGDCDMALAGGVSVHLSPRDLGPPRDSGVIAWDGHCRPFDAAANGTVGANGVGIVVLRRLDDALEAGDHIHAIVRGSAINNDGTGKVGFTAPSVNGQASAIRTALALADVDPSTIGFVEAHGTGTAMGDPIEVAALVKAFGRRRDGWPCWLGSIKSNIGHTDAAAGVAGFIKAVLAVKHGVIPPTLHYTTPNPEVDFGGGTFDVNATCVPWPNPGHPRRAGISSLGIGGTNAHVVIEQAPHWSPAQRTPSYNVPRLLVLSARTPAGLARACDRLASHLEVHPELGLGDVAYTLQSGRAEHRHRRTVVAELPEHAVAALRDRDLAAGTEASQSPPVVFMFPGQGGQHIAMGRQLAVNYPVFRRHFDECCSIASDDLGVDLGRILHPETGELDEAAAHLAAIEIGQPAVFAVEYALARLWMDAGITPAGVVGHSLGAYAAACIAGVFSLEDAVRVVVARGRLLRAAAHGTMLAIALGERDVQPFLDDVDLAVVNGPTQCVVAGSTQSIADVERRLSTAGVDSRRLRIGSAGHCRMVDPIAGDLGTVIAGVRREPARFPFLSDTTGRWLHPDEPAQPAFWSRHLRQTVRFGDVVTELMADPQRVMLEVGPGQTLSALIRQHPACTPHRGVIPSMPRPHPPASEAAALLNAAGQLWERGTAIRWNAVRGGTHDRRVPLPTYPFERVRHRVGEESATVAATTDTGTLRCAPARPAPLPLEVCISAAFGRVLGIRRVNATDNFFELGGDSLIAAQLVAQLRRDAAVDVGVRQILEAPTVSALTALLTAGGLPSDGSHR